LNNNKKDLPTLVNGTELDEFIVFQTAAHDAFLCELKDFKNLIFKDIGIKTRSKQNAVYL